VSKNIFINPPFNYTGSKYKLLPQILPEFDYSKKLMVDLFTGGGSVMYNCIDKFEVIIANDIIKPLMNIHYMMLTRPEYLIKRTKQVCALIKNKHSYNKVRQIFNDHNSHPALLWALMLTCNSNMIRFNYQMKFNQTCGLRNWNSSTDKKVFKLLEHLKKQKINIKCISREFYNVPIEWDELKKIINLDIDIKKAFYYIDPPYSNTHAGYNCFWTKKHDIDLYEYILKLNDYGHTFCLSGILHHNNKESILLTNLIKHGFNVVEIDADYNKVQNTKRGKVPEIIIKNF